MRRLAVGVLLFGMTLGFSVCGLGMTPAVAQQDGAALIGRIDGDLMTAVRNKNRRAVSSYLAAKFNLTDSSGRLRSRSEFLKDLSLLASADQGESDVKTYFYGRIATVLGKRGNARFVRIWVEREQGWKLFIVLETPIPTQAPAQASVEAASGAGDCDNPCRTVPFSPRTDMDRAILAAWQQTKLAEWKPNAEVWARYIADEFMIINNTTIRNREQRVVIAKRQQETGVGTPGDPVVFMRIHDFPPDTAVMVTRHTPYRGGKPYTNVRVWVKRDNRWQLALSQQVTIEAAQPVPAVTARK